MRFLVTPEHVKQRSRKSTFIALVLIVLSVICILALLSANFLSDTIFPIIGLLLLVPPIPKIYSIIKEDI